MGLDVDSTVKKIKSKVHCMRFSANERHRQRNAVGFVEPLLYKAEKTGYGLMPERSVDAKTVKKDLEVFLGTGVFSLIPVNTSGMRLAPDWARHSALNQTILSNVFSGGTGKTPLKENMDRMISTLSSPQKDELFEINRIIREQICPELAKKLAHDIGMFGWTRKDNQRIDGPLAICQLSVYPVLTYFFTAVKTAEWNEAEKALAIINHLRGVIPIGDKAVSPKSWYLLTAP